MNSCIMRAITSLIVIEMPDNVNNNGGGLKFMKLCQKQCESIFVEIIFQQPATYLAPYLEDHYKIGFQIEKSMQILHHSTHRQLINLR